MIPGTDTALKVIVERAVRPVQATLSHKKKMREELLAHVTQVFDEELAASHDEAVAVATTAERFGDPQQVGLQLQESVPRWKRAYMWFDELMKPTPGDRPAVAALRVARNMTIVTVGTMCFAMMLAIGATDFFSQKLVLLSFLVPSAVTLAFISFTYALLAILVRRDWFAATGTHSRLRLTVYLAASLVPVLVVPFIFALFIGNMHEVPQHLESIIPFSPLIPAALYFVTRQYHRECEYANEWKSLQLD